MTINQIESLADALQKECARVRIVLGHYKEIGPAGAIIAFSIEVGLQQADAAMVYGDVVVMLLALTELKSIKE